MSTRLISQQANFKADFGHVYRSSAIFHFKQSRSPQCKTTLSFMNYWPLKRGNQVSVVASLRDLSGKLVQREPLPFTDGQVRNYSPLGGTDFEGSVEIEAFGNSNLVIPYAAIVGIYETAKGVTFVHSYARAYSRHEVEDARTIVEGEEGCWTLRDTAARRSFAVFHNGPEREPAQRIRLTVRNSKGQTRMVESARPELAPYETVKVRPREWIPDLVEFLGGAAGFATLSFRLNEGFTRMLVGTEAIDGSDLQVTHSNFNYGKHQTDLVTAEKSTAYMVTSCFPDLKRAGLVYPDTEPGKYWMKRENGEELAFQSGEPVFFDVREAETVFEFGQREGRGLPSRIVTALICENASGALPAECSLGVIHHQRPPKKMWWGACSANPALRSRIAAIPITSVYGGVADGQTARLTLYNANDDKKLERSLGAADIESLARGRYVDDLFPEAPAVLGEAFGFFTLVSDYGGLWCFSTLEKETGGFALEHGF